MRYLLALLLAFAVAAPPVYAASSKARASSNKSASASKADQNAKSGKRSRQSSDRGGAGGIHPLVGSGDY